MEYGKAFTFMFADPNWVRKLVIGVLMVLIGSILSPILIGIIPLLMVAGYTLDLVRNVIHRQPHPLPEWEDWGGMLVRGIKMAAAFIIWSLPIIVVAIPLGIGGGLLGNESSGAQVMGGLLVTCGTCLTLLWAIFVTLLSPAIFVRLAATGRFGAAFELGALWSLTRDHLGPVIIALLLIWVAGLIAGILGLAGIVLCFVGLLVTIPLATLWQYLVAGHLFGQIGVLAGYGEGLTGLELVAPPPSPMAPPPPAAEPLPAEELPPQAAEPVAPAEPAELAAPSAVQAEPTAAPAPTEEPPASPAS